MNDTPIVTYERKKERAVLCGLAAACFAPGESSTDVSMAELAALVETAGVLKRSCGEMPREDINIMLRIYCNCKCKSRGKFGRPTRQPPYERSSRRSGGFQQIQK